MIRKGEEMPTNACPRCDHPFEDHDWAAPREGTPRVKRPCIQCSSKDVRGPCN